MKLRCVSLGLLTAVVVCGCNDHTVMQLSQDRSASIGTRSSERGMRSYFHPELDWGVLQDHGQKVEACQIPDDVVKNLPTEELVELLAEYPLLFDAYAYDNARAGLDIVMAHYNGAVELLERKDNIQCMADYIMASQSEEAMASVKARQEEGGHSLVIAAMEMAASREEMMRNADAKTLEKLNSITGKTLKNKIADPDTYGVFSQSATMYLMLKSEARAERKSAAADTAVEKFLANGIITSEEEYNQILEYCKSKIQ